jgi:hypothetical protein
MDEELKKVVANLAEAAQEVADRLPDHIKTKQDSLGVKFPWGVIRPLKDHYVRWPYLCQERKRTAACTIQLGDVNRWHLNVWGLGLTAGTMWVWHCTLPVIALVETLAYEYARQFNLNAEGEKPKKVIDTLQTKGVIDHKLSG